MTADIITLRDEDSGAMAKIMASQGFNCFSFVVPVGGAEVETIWAEPGYEAGDRRASGSGTPVLFPFPGRIAGTSMHWDGKDWPLEAGDGRGNAIHGFVHTRPWRVVERNTSSVAAEFQASVDDAEILKHWPADFRLRAAATVTGNSFLLTIVADNPGDKPLPCGLGLHPYFKAPLGSTASECKVHLPVSNAWEMHEMIATGQREPLADAAEYQGGLNFAEMKFDNGFGGLVFEDGTCASQIVDTGAGVSLELAFNDVFRECVVYTPPHREAVCIEPYTCVCDPVRLEAEGHDAGLRVLQPGEGFTAEMKITLTNT